MIEHLPKLEPWHDFYLVVGTGAAALTGLLFVIVSLGPHVVANNTRTGVRAFISPIAAHFTTVVVASSVMLVPEIPFQVLGAMLGVAGLGGLIYTAWTRAHQRWRAGELPVLDWIWFVGLPYLCFAAMFASGAAIAMREALGLHGIAATLLFMIVVGIRNAWDIVLWVTQRERPEKEAAAPATRGKPGKRGPARS
jgi:hypothetical protein